MSLLPACTSEHHVHAVPIKATVFKELELYTWLRAILYMLGIKPRSSAKATRALNHRLNSPAPKDTLDMPSGSKLPMEWEVKYWTGASDTFKGFNPLTLHGFTSSRHTT